MSARRLLVTGARGFLGSWIVREALRDGWDVHVLVRSKDMPRLGDLAGAVVPCLADLRDTASVERMVRRCRPSCVAHAAFPSGYATDSKLRRDMLEGGVQGTANLLEALRRIGTVTHLVHTGSATVYGPSDRPHRPTDPARPVNFRGACKACAWILCAQFGASTGAICSDVRLFSIFGPWEQPGRLIPRALKAGLEGAMIQLTREPHRRNWIYAEDAAKACLKPLATAIRTPLVFNCCSSNVVTTHETIGVLEEIVGRKLVGGFSYAALDSYGDKDPRAVVPKARDAGGWKMATKLEKGLANCWAWAQTAPGRAHLGVT